MKKFAVICSLLAIMISGSSLAMAEEEMEIVDLSYEEPSEPINTERLEENYKFLDKFKDELQYSRTSYRQVLNNIANTEYQLSQVVKQKVDLEYQIVKLSGLIAETTDKLLTVIDQGIQTENELNLLAEDIEMGQIALEYQKQVLRDYAAVLYQEELEYFSIEDGEVNAFKLLLADRTVGENLQELKYFDLLNETGQQMLEKLDEISYDLEVRKGEYLQKKDELDLLEAEVVEEKIALEEQKTAKERLLTMTQGQELIYSQLLEQSELEQNEALDSLRLLSQAVVMIEGEITELGDEFDPSEYENLLSVSGQALYDFHIRYRGLSDGRFDWPVDPFKGLSAYFRDPGYAGAFGVRHNAIDIPTYQGTPVRSAADGVVFKTKDNGYGYSYIIVVHAGGVSTVYGHMSKILVKIGDTIGRGSIIGLSGGMPGTKGAGYMTTGPHLHFELHKDGDYTDPLLYMPLEILTEEQMEWLPEAYKKSWREDVREARDVLLERFEVPVEE